MTVVKLIVAFVSMCIGSVILAIGYIISTVVTIVIYFFWDVWVNFADALKANTKGFLTSINNNRIHKKN